MQVEEGPLLSGWELTETRAPNQTNVNQRITNIALAALLVSTVAIKVVNLSGIPGLPWVETVTNISAGWLAALLLRKLLTPEQLREVVNFFNSLSIEGLEIFSQCYRNLANEVLSISAANQLFIAPIGLLFGFLQTNNVMNGLDSTQGDLPAYDQNTPALPMLNGDALHLPTTLAITTLKISLAVPSIYYGYTQGIPLLTTAGLYGAGDAIGNLVSCIMKLIIGIERKRVSRNIHRTNPQSRLLNLVDRAQKLLTLNSPIVMTLITTFGANFLKNKLPIPFEPIPVGILVGAANQDKRGEFQHSPLNNRIEEIRENSLVETINDGTVPPARIRQISTFQRIINFMKENGLVSIALIGFALLVAGFASWTFATGDNRDRITMATIIGSLLSGYVLTHLIKATLDPSKRTQPIFQPQRSLISRVGRNVTQAVGNNLYFYSYTCAIYISILYLFSVSQRVDLSNHSLTNDDLEEFIKKLIAWGSLGAAMGNNRCISDTYEGRHQPTPPIFLVNAVLTLIYQGLGKFNPHGM